MTDVTTQKPLRVIDDDMGPYMLLPFDQLDELQRLLDSRGIKYSVEEDVISINDGPEIAAINFSRDADAAVMQAILDSVR